MLALKTEKTPLGNREYQKLLFGLHNPSSLVWWHTKNHIPGCPELGEKQFMEKKDQRKSESLCLANATTDCAWKPPGPILAAGSASLHLIFS